MKKGKDIILYPMAIIDMTTYYDQKRSEQKRGLLQQNKLITYGLLYGQQKEIKTMICWSTPLGINQQEVVQQLVQRALHYEFLRLRKSYQSINYYDEFNLIGCYAFGKGVFTTNGEVKKLSKQLKLRGAPIFILAQPHAPYPKIFKTIQDDKCEQIGFITETERADRICMNTYHNFNNVKQENFLTKFLQKQKNILSEYYQKSKQMCELAKSNQCSDRQKQNINQILQDYDRLVARNYQRKKKQIQALNSSVMVGLSLDHYLKRWGWE